MSKIVFVAYNKNGVQGYAAVGKHGFHAEGFIGWKLRKGKGSFAVEFHFVEECDVWFPSDEERNVFGEKTWKGAYESVGGFNETPEEFREFVRAYFPKTGEFLDGRGQ